MPLGQITHTPTAVKTYSTLGSGSMQAKQAAGLARNEQSVLCPAKEGEFFLLAGLRTVVRFFENLVSFLWYAVRCCPAKEVPPPGIDLSWIDADALRQLVSIQGAPKIEKTDDGFKLSQGKKETLVTISTNDQGDLVVKFSNRDFRTKRSPLSLTLSGARIYRDQPAKGADVPRVLSFWEKGERGQVTLAPKTSASVSKTTYFAIDRQTASEALVKALLHRVKEPIGWEGADDATAEVLLENGFVQDGSAFTIDARK